MSEVKSPQSEIFTPSKDPYTRMCVLTSALRLHHGQRRRTARGRV